jgi:large subunit ribosomal protein L25
VQEGIVTDNALVAEPRTGTGKGVARKLRAAGRIPGVVYGPGKPPTPVTLDPRALERVLHGSGSGMNTLIDLDVSGLRRTVLVKELQRDPVRGAWLHADLYEVDLEKPIRVEVPLHFVGKAKGIEFGGILDHAVRELEIMCLPRAIPDHIEVNVDSLEIGQSLHVRDLTLPEGVTLLSDPDLTVASVLLPAAVEEAAPAAAEVAPVEGAEAAKTEEE